jgi:hydrogenase maturation protease
MASRVLVAGIGNIFMGDDAFGVEVAQRLAARNPPEGTQVTDFGIRSFDLAYALMGDFETVILLDSTHRDGKPGTLYTIEPDLSELNSKQPQEEGFDSHTMDPMAVFRLVKTMGGELTARILLVGCEPETFGPENEGQMGLSQPVQAAVTEAVGVVESLLDGMLPRNVDSASNVSR